MIRSTLSPTTLAYVGLGSNLGDRHTSLTEAVSLLRDNDDVEVTRVSDFCETQPLGQADQPKYLNAVAEVRTTLDARTLFHNLRHIEDQLGRKRNGKWSSRSIDLDLLLFGNEVISEPDLVVPHESMHLRSFVLAPLAQMTPEATHPVLKASMATLNQRVGKGNFVKDVDKPQLISIAGNIGVGKSTLAERLAQVLGATAIYEPYDTNPFLPEVYAGRKEYALDSQLHFLVHRAAQIGRDSLNAGQCYVTDYLFDKEGIYARRLLDERQLTLYEQLYTPFAAQVADPVLVIYLHDSSKHCLERIRLRNRAYEQRIQETFLESLDADYEALIQSWDHSPVIRLDVSTFDSLKAEDLESLVEQVRHYVWVVAC